MLTNKNTVGEMSLGTIMLDKMTSNKITVDKMTF